MKEEKYRKAIKVHQEKLYGYALRLHSLVDEMLDDTVSTNDVLGVLEAEKMWRFSRSVDCAKASALDEILDEIAGMLEEEDDYVD